jgi:GNAT superfamily N-acetyltransferase
VIECKDDKSRKETVAHMITYKLLNEYPNHIDELALWMFEKWGKYYPGSTLERVQQWLQKSAQTSGIPITYLALDGSTLVGCSMLQRTELYQEEGVTPWLGALLVKDKYQQQGIGRHLLNWAQTHTKDMGHKKLFLLLFDPNMCDWYLENGWEIFKTDESRHHPLIVMRTALS